MTCEKKSSDKNFGAECGPDATPMLSQAKVWRPQNKRITTRSFAALRMTNKGGGGTRSLPPTTLGPFDSLRSRPSTAPLGCAPLGFAPLDCAPRLRSPRLRSPRLRSGQAGQAGQARRQRRGKPAPIRVCAALRQGGEAGPRQRRGQAVHLRHCRLETPRACKHAPYDSLRSG